MRAPRPWWWMSGRQLDKCWTAFWISPTVATAPTGLWWKPSPSYRWVSEQLQLISATLEANKRCLWFVVVDISETSAVGVTMENTWLQPTSFTLSAPSKYQTSPGETTCRSTLLEICMSNIYVCFLLFVVSERIFEDHENLVENLLNWTRDSHNKLMFTERIEKYALFKNPQVTTY